MHGQNDICRGTGPFDETPGNWMRPGSGDIDCIEAPGPPGRLKALAEFAFFLTFALTAGAPLKATCRSSLAGW